MDGMAARLGGGSPPHSLDLLLEVLLVEFLPPLAHHHLQAPLEYPVGPGEVAAHHGQHRDLPRPPQHRVREAWRRRHVVSSHAQEPNPHLGGPVGPPAEGEGKENAQHRAHVLLRDLLAPHGLPERYGQKSGDLRRHDAHADRAGSRRPVAEVQGEPPHGHARDVVHQKVFRDLVPHLRPYPVHEHHGEDHLLQDDRGPELDQKRVQHGHARRRKGEEAEPAQKGQKTQVDRHERRLRVLRAPAHEALGHQQHHGQETPVSEWNVVPASLAPCTTCVLVFVAVAAEGDFQDPRRWKPTAPAALRRGFHGTGKITDPAKHGASRPRHSP
mmetsp:Transcript_1959/g.5989  ORF Transcript_1959/g.5989 Transcript_1959/m.5989 type:complete len:328 (+) Transcript_1959:2723-3706(+)